MKLVIIPRLQLFTCPAVFKTIGGHYALRGIVCPWVECPLGMLCRRADCPRGQPVSGDSVLYQLVIKMTATSLYHLQLATSNPRWLLVCVNSPIAPAYTQHLEPFVISILNLGGARIILRAEGGSQIV